MSYWRGKNVLVTGAEGFLGPWLVQDLLNAGAQVTVLVRDRVSGSRFFKDGIERLVCCVYGDLLDRELLIRVLNEYAIHTIFHLGAQAIVGIANRSPISTFRSNIEGTWNMLEAVRLSPWVRSIVVASSDKAYGMQERLPYTEAMPLEGRHPYDVSKSCADLIAQSYFHTYGMNVCVTRCGNFFGGGDLHTNRIIPHTILSALAGNAPVIRSDGSFIRDYIYVKDVAHAYMTLAEAMEDGSLAGESFNFSTDTPLSVLEVVDLVLSRMGAGDLEPVIKNTASGEIPKQHLSSQKARRVLGWNPKYGIERGIDETVMWYRQDRHTSVFPKKSETVL